jgi:hypothetical protein
MKSITFKSGSSWHYAAYIRDSKYDLGLREHLASVHQTEPNKFVIEYIFSNFWPLFGEPPFDNITGLTFESLEEVETYLLGYFFVDQL